jgi:hypothetical protein
VGSLDVKENVPVSTQCSDAAGNSAFEMTVGPLTMPGKISIESSSVTKV